MNIFGVPEQIEKCRSVDTLTYSDRLQKSICDPSLPVESTKVGWYSDMQADDIKEVGLRCWSCQWWSNRHFLWLFLGLILLIFVLVPPKSIQILVMATYGSMGFDGRPCADRWLTPGDPVRLRCHHGWRLRAARGSASRPCDCTFVLASARHVGYSQWGHVLSRLKFPDQLLAQNMKPLSFCRQMKKKKRSQRRTAVVGGLGMAGIGEGIGVNLNSNKISGITSFS